MHSYILLFTIGDGVTMNISRETKNFHVLDRTTVYLWPIKLSSTCSIHVPPHRTCKRMVPFLLTGDFPCHCKKLWGSWRGTRRTSCKMVMWNFSTLRTPEYLASVAHSSKNTIQWYIIRLTVSREKTQMLTVICKNPFLYLLDLFFI